MITVDMSLITLEIDKDYTSLAEECLAKLGITSYHTSVGRSTVGRESHGVVSIFKPVVYEEEPLSVISFVSAREDATEAAAFLVQELNLAVPGRGSLSLIPTKLGLQSEEQKAGYRVTVPEFVSDAERPLLLGGIGQVVAIVQRGEGTPMSTAALNLGQSVPSVTFGIGMGLREKLNLIRITFPRDKEIVRLTVNAEESEEIFNQLVDAGNLDQPGKGFIYLAPIEVAVPNTLLFRGSQRHAATIEQIIQALDNIQGSNEWRRKKVGAAEGLGSGRSYLEGMVEITARILEGRGQNLVLEAMGSGSAGGATISKCRLVRTIDGSRTAVGMEELYMIVPEASAEKVLAVLEKAGLFDEGADGSVVYRPVFKACTYLSK